MYGHGVKGLRTGPDDDAEPERSRPPETELMSIDVEAAKRAYLSQWYHCPGKRLTAIDSKLLCDCGESAPWTRTLGEDVELAVELEWLSPNGMLFSAML